MTITLTSINQPISIMDMQFPYSDVGTEFFKSYLSEFISQSYNLDGVI